MDVYGNQVEPFDEDDVILIDSSANVETRHSGPPPDTVDLFEASSDEEEAVREEEEEEQDVEEEEEREPYVFRAAYSHEATFLKEVAPTQRESEREEEKISELPETPPPFSEPQEKDEPSVSLYSAPQEEPQQECCHQCDSEENSCSLEQALRLASWVVVVCAILFQLLFVGSWDASSLGWGGHTAQSDDTAPSVYVETTKDVLTRLASQRPALEFVHVEIQLQDLSLEVATEICASRNNNARLLRTHGFETLADLAMYVPRLAEPVDAKVMPFSLWRLGASHFGLVCYDLGERGQRYDIHYSKDNMNFVEANETCSKHGQVMAKVEGRDQWLAVMREVSEPQRYGIFNENQDYWTRGFWIGLHDREHQGRYHWTADGSFHNPTTTSFPRWMLHNPNNYPHSSSQDEDCVQLHWEEGKLNDLPCDIRLPAVVCEFT